MATPANLLDNTRLAADRTPAATDASHTDALRREHYLIERELAHRLRNASRAERRTLYTELYNELFRRFPQHPQFINKESPERRARRTREAMSLLGRFLSKDNTFLEVGPGDCALSFHVARQVKFVYGVDVSSEITRSVVTPPNFRLCISDGTSIPADPGSVDVVYSNQLMEHLHPDDALEQLQNIRRALARDGIYICITPSRLTGPHDVSRYFDPVATGFHLKEYTATELAKLFKQVGFRKIRVAIGARGIFLWIPVWVLWPIERLVEALPARMRRRVARSAAFRRILGVRMRATNGGLPS